MQQATRREALRLYANAVLDMDAYSLAGLIPVETLRKAACALVEQEKVRYFMEGGDGSYDAVLAYKGYKGRSLEDCVKPFSPGYVECMYLHEADGGLQRAVLPSWVHMLGTIKDCVGYTYGEGYYLMCRKDGTFGTAEEMAQHIVELYHAANAAAYQGDEW